MPLVVALQLLSDFGWINAQSEGDLAHHLKHEPFPCLIVNAHSLMAVYALDLQALNGSCDPALVLESSLQLSGLPNANAKSQRFSYAISQIAPLPPVAPNRRSKSQIAASYAAFWNAIPKSHWPLSFRAHRFQHFGTQGIQDTNATKSQTLAFYESQRFSATKVFRPLARRGTRKRQNSTVCKLGGVHCKRRGSEKSTFLAIFCFLIFSGAVF